MDDRTRRPADLSELARSIVDSNRFMALGTADAGGVPWVSPVWYAHAQYRQFFWVSSPEARHSRNIASRPEVAVVIFDSHETGGWKSVYMSGVAEELADVREEIQIFSRRSEEQGFPAWTEADVRAPARHRLYRATATEHFVLDDRDKRLPVDLQ